MIKKTRYCDACRKMIKEGTMAKAFRKTTEIFICPFNSTLLAQMFNEQETVELCEDCFKSFKEWKIGRKYK